MSPGKSFVIGAIKQELARMNKKFVVTAWFPFLCTMLIRSYSTGIAAANIGGITLHSWAGIRTAQTEAEVNSAW